LLVDYERENSKKPRVFQRKLSFERLEQNNFLIMLEKRVASFKYAFNGIAVLFKSQPNARIHLTVAVAVIVAGCYFRIALQDEPRLKVITTRRTHLPGRSGISRLPSIQK
jgi:hypothetical protein